MNTASTTTPSQRETNTIPIAKTASTMFAMDAMLTRWPDQLKMPRQDAYETAVPDNRSQPTASAALRLPAAPDARR